MVSIVAGAGLGLGQTSAKTLGSGGVFGAPTQGFLGSSYLVNASSGNVIIQNQDEVLTGIGQDLILTRTYNSLGLSNDDNGDNWRESVQRKVSGLSGTVNTAGSTITRTDWDGSVQTFSYDTARSAYVFRNAAGDIDTLTYSSSSNQWSWTGGVSRVVETYDNANSGRILSSMDADGKALTFSYTGTNLTRVTDSNGEYVTLSWSGNNLTQLSTYKADGTLLVSRVRYAYDTSNRLTSVTVDLTPSDNSVSDGNVITYSYTYDGTSNRVASISETGSNALVAFQYDATTRKVIKVTETAASGDVRVTNIDYSVANRARITDAQGNNTDYFSDASGRLTSITYPTGQTIAYTWDAATGKISTITDSLGHVTTYSYDANGNLTRSLDAGGNQIDRTYDATTNALLTETRYLTPDPDGAGPVAASNPATTRYAYNAQNHLRFVISAQGQVTEYRYNAAGQQVSSLDWAANNYDISSLGTNASISEATMATWVAGIADKSTVQRTDYVYDFRGNLQTSTAWTAADTSGVGLSSAPSTVTTFAYDQFGLLLSKQVSGRTGAEVYTYDGLGRLLTSTDLAGNMTRVVIDNGNRRTVVTLANSETTTSNFNALGQLLDKTVAASGASSQAQVYKYDSLGRLRTSIDALSTKDFTFYDAVGRKVGYMDRLGNLTEFRYDAANRLVAKISYATTISASSLATLFDASGNPQNVSFASIRPASSGADQWTFDVYDNADRLVQEIQTVADASDVQKGQVTTYSYDGAGKIVNTVQSSNLLSENIIAQYKSNPPSALNLMPNASLDGDISNWSQWGQTGVTYNQQPTLVTDGQGNKSVTTSLQSSIINSLAGLISVNSTPVQAGQKLAVSLKVSGSGALNSIKFSVEFWGASGWLGSTDIATISTNLAAGTVISGVTSPVPAGTTRMNLIAWANVSATGSNITLSASNAMVSYATPTQTAANLSFSATPQSSSTDRVSRFFYDQAGQKIGALDADGALTRIIYDAAGRVVETVQYATLTSASLRANGSFTDLLASVTATANSADRHQYFAYDGQGNPRFSLDANLRPTEMVYDSAGALIRTISYAGTIASSASYSLFYIQGQITSLGLASNSATRTTRVVYDGAGRKAFEINAEGDVIGYAYNTLNQVVKLTGYANLFTTAGDQTLSQMQSWATTNSGTSDRISRSVYDALGRVVYEIDPEGFVTEHQYDIKNRVVKDIRYPAAQAVTDGVTQASLAAQIGAIPATAVVQTYVYDANGNRTQVTDGAGIITSYAYDTFGRATRITNPTSGSATNLVYDAMGRIVQKTTAFGSSAAATVTYVYDGVGNLLSSTDARGYTTTYIYDAAGNQLTQSVPLTFNPTNSTITYAVTSRQYDAFGNVVTSVDALGGTTWFYYDKLNRLTWQVDAEGYATQTQYSNGNAVTSVRRLVAKPTGTGSATSLPTFTTSSSDALTTFNRDKLDRVTATIDAEGYTESYALNAFGDRVAVTNKIGGITNNIYDRRGLLVQETLPVGSTRSNGSVQSANIINTYQYDANSNLIKKVEASGLTEQRTTTYAYDLDNRLISKTSDAVTTVNPDTMAQTSSAAVIETYKYDANGNLIEKDDANGNRALSWYDAGNRKVAEVNPLGQLTTWTYDANGNVLSSRVYGDLIALPTTPGGATPTPVNGNNYRETTYTYDANNRLTTTNIAGLTIGKYSGSTYSAQTGPITTSLQYDANGNVIAQTDGNGGKVYTWYNKLGQKIAQIDQSLYMTRWMLDAEGNVLTESRYATPVTASITAGGNPPAINLLANSDFSQGLSGWTIGTNPNNILKAGSPYTLTNVNGTGTNSIKAEFNATAAGQVVSLASATNTPVVAGDRLAIQVGVEGIGSGIVGHQDLTAWFFDANGIAITGTAVASVNGTQAYNTKIGGFIDVPQGAVSMRLELYMNTAGAGLGSLVIAQPMVASVAKTQTQLPMFSANLNGVAGLTDARTTLFTYDRNGRRLTETRLNVAKASVSGQSISETKASAKITYTYNGLGLVTSKQEATGDTTSYGYDAAGRQTSIAGQAFTDYTGANVSNLQQIAYDGLGNVTRSVENSSRVTTYTYGTLGRLASSTDPLGNITSYAYDAGGRVVATTSYLSRADGSGQYVARVLKYDAAGHQIAQRTFVSSNGTSWTRAGDATDYFYDAYGEVIARGTNSNGDITKAQEFNDYDAAGRVWRTNFGNGVTKAYLFDANGNATMLLQSMGSINLKTAYASASAMLGDTGISKTISVYDARNKLTDTIQSTSNNAGASPVHATQTSATGQGTVYFNSNASVNSTNRNTTGSVAYALSTNSSAGAHAAGSISITSTNYEAQTGTDEKPKYIYRSKIDVSISSLPNGSLNPINVYVQSNNGKNLVGTMGATTTNAWFGIGTTSNGPDPFANVSGPITITLEQEPVTGAGFVVLARQDISSIYYFDGTHTSISTSTQVNPNLDLNSLPSDTRLVRIFARPSGSMQPYTYAGNASPVTGTAGAVPGWYTFDLTQPPFNGLGANTSWDVWYEGLGDNGNITDAKQGTVSAGSSGILSTSLSAIPVNGPGQTLATWDGSYYTLLFTGLPTTTQNLRVYYRLAGSNNAFTQLAVNTTARGGAYGQAGWWSGRPPADGQTYEYWVEPLDANGAIIGGRSYGTYSSNANPSSLTQYAAATPTITFQPPSGQTVTSQRMRYYAAGSWSNWITYGAGGNWSYNASALAPDFYSNYSYPIQYETYNGSTLVSQGSATLSLGYNGQSVSNYTNLQSVAAQVVFSPLQQGGTTLKLYWRDQGSTGAYTPVTLTRSGNSYSWNVDSPSVRPTSGTRILEYYYDTYDASGNRLSTLTGTDHVQGTISISADQYAQTSDTEIRWTMDTAPASQFLVHRAQSYNAFGDVVSETDGRGNVTQLFYNTEGKLIRKIAPQVSVTDEAGNTTLTNPTEYYYYDVSGRQIAQRDANGNLMTQTLLAGSGYGGSQAAVTTVFKPGSTTTYGYDVWGDQRKVTDGLGNVTMSIYDANHNLIEVDHAVRSGGNSNGVQFKDYYAYDALGERIKHWNSQLGAGVVETTDYDVMGRVTKTVSMAGQTTSYGYYWYPGIDPLGGYAHISTVGLGDFGGWQKITTTSAGVTSYENDDIFGNLTWRKDFGGRAYWYGFDLNGHLTNQGNDAGQNIAYSYYENGYIKSINDYALHMLSTFQYDNDGNRTLETYNSTNAGGVTDGSSVYYQNATIAYDAMNRITEFKDAKADITYKYDAVGNRRNVHSVYQDGVGGNQQVQDYWYKYDGQNRFVLTMGSLLNGAIITGSAGVALTYDAAGNRASAAYGYDGHLERYSYTADGYLENTWKAPSGGSETLLASRTNDALGRVTQYTEYTNGAASLSRSSNYDNDNRVVSDTTNSVSGSVTTTTVQTYDYRQWNTAASAYSGADQGILTHVRADQSQSNTSGHVYTDTTYNYVWWDEAKQSSIKIGASDPSNPNSGQWAPGLSNLSYDVNGHITQLVDTMAAGGAKTVNYRQDAYGQVLVREESQNGVIGPRQLYYYFDSKRIGDVSNNGPSASQIDYAQQLANASSSKRDGLWRNGKPVSSADFDQSYQPINSAYPSSAAGTYTVRSGDSLQTIAASMWGDSSLWYLLADANGIGASTQLVAGQRLIIPNKVSNFHNNSSTFKVYDPGEAIGDTLPTLPNEPAPPPANNGGSCGGFGAILLVIVAVAVTAYFAPQLIGQAATLGTGAGTTAATVAGVSISLPTVTTVAATGLTATLGATGAAIAGGALAAAAGSMVSQGIGVVTGLQNNFSWSAVGMAALGGAVSGGFSSLGAATRAGSILGNQIAGKVVSAAISNAATQGLGIATGLQNNFDWAGVAAAGASTGVGARVGRLNWAGETGSVILSNVAGGIAASAGESLVSGRDFGDTIIANMPSIIGNTVGNLVAQGVSDSSGNTADGGSNCFPAGTMVHARDGLRPIETIRVGDWVAARPEANPEGAFIWRKVIRTFVHPEIALLSLAIQHPDGTLESISTTPEHPFFINGGEWRNAGELRPGDRFSRLDGGQSTLIGLNAENGLHTVYNFTVDQNHTYFVGNGGIWVHNSYFWDRVKQAFGGVVNGVKDLVTGNWSNLGDDVHDVTHGVVHAIIGRETLTTMAPKNADSEATGPEIVVVGRRRSPESSYSPNIEYHTATYGRRGPDPRRVTYGVLTNPRIDSSAINNRYGTNVDLQFITNQEGGVIVTPYVPWANGMRHNASGITLGAGLDLGQQTRQSWLTIAGGNQGLFDTYSGALGLHRQDAVDWGNAHANLQLSPDQAELITENTLGTYVANARITYDRTLGAGAFSGLNSAQQTVFVDRVYNANGPINSAFRQFVYRGDWDGAGSYLRSQATAHANTALGTRLGAEATLLGH